MNSHFFKDLTTAVAKSGLIGDSLKAQASLAYEVWLVASGSSWPGMNEHAWNSGQWAYYELPDNFHCYCNGRVEGPAGTVMIAFWFNPETELMQWQHVFFAAPVVKPGPRPPGQLKQLSWESNGPLMLLAMPFKQWERVLRIVIRLAQGEYQIYTDDIVTGLYTEIGRAENITLAKELAQGWWESIIGGLYEQ